MKSLIESFNGITIDYNYAFDYKNKLMNKKLLEFNERLKKSKIAIIGLGVSNLPLLDYLYMC